MKSQVVDCFLLMNTAMSIKGVEKLPEMSRPILQDVFTTVINLTLTVESFRIITDKPVEAQLVGLLSQHWVDPRLGSNIRTRKKAVAGQIWKPKLTNVNGDSSVDFRDDTMFWRGYGDEGNILLSEKVQISKMCTNYFQNFPFDKHICEFKFGSYRFPVEEVSIKWKNDIGIQLKISTDLGEFLLTNITAFTEMDIRPSGNFSVAVVQFEVTRQALHYMFCIVLPGLVLTVLSYISLWFHNKNTRMITSLFTFSALLALNYTTVCHMQHASYLKALDIFIILCTTSSFLILLDSLMVDAFCKSECETNFTVGEKTSGKKYPRSLYYFELALKIALPLFYILSLVVYIYKFIHV